LQLLGKPGEMHMGTGTFVGQGLHVSCKQGSRTCPPCELQLAAVVGKVTNRSPRRLRRRGAESACFAGCLRHDGAIFDRHALRLRAQRRPVCPTIRTLCQIRV
jgi:hypothetical protein